MDAPSDQQPAVKAEPQARDKTFPCRQCGASLVYKPGTAVLKCEYCGHENVIPQSEDEIGELDFREFLGRAAEAAETREAPMVRCQVCGAEMERPEHTTAFACPFCGTDVVATATSRKLIKPRSLLPFEVSREQAREAFRKWVRSRWFAPGQLKKLARLETRLNGTYVPFWTYDCHTISHYTGQRGVYYYTTRTVRTKHGTRTSHVRRIRWTPASGVVFNTFDDVLVMASHSLPDKHARRLEPWDLKSLVPYADEYLSGFTAESYQIDLAAGFETAKEIMDGPIRETIRDDIGGDQQQIHSVRTQYDNITFKHILLPVWISAYRFRDKVYRFLVNARTGEVQGERPWSWIKITALILIIAVIAAAIVYFTT